MVLSPKFLEGFASLGKKPDFKVFEGYLIEVFASLFGESWSDFLVLTVFDVFRRESVRRSESVDLEDRPGPFSRSTV